MFSMLLKYSPDELDITRITLIQHVVCLAAIQAIQRLGETRGLPHLLEHQQVGIKWPNDIYARGKRNDDDDDDDDSLEGCRRGSDGDQPSCRVKIGGVLCQSSGGASGVSIVVGVGLNVFNDAPTTCLQTLVDDECVREGVPLESLRPVTREEVLGMLCTSFEDLMQTLTGPSGFVGGLQHLYKRHWIHQNETVLIDPSAIGTTTSPSVTPRTGVIQAVVMDISASGYLVAQDDTGQKYQLDPDLNSLNILSGVVRSKYYDPR